MLNDHIKCYSVRFHGFGKEYEDFESEDPKPSKSKYFEYTTLSTEMSRNGSVTNLKDLDKEILTVRRGAQVNFDFYPDKSVGMMDHSAINPNGKKDAADVYSDPKAWSAFIWDSQFTRYLQVLDTDEEHNYIILY